MEGWHADCVAQQRFVQGHYGKGGQTPKTFIESQSLQKLDESFGFICIHISKELLFQPDGLKNSREVWKKLESLFGKKYELRGHIL